MDKLVLLDAEIKRASAQALLSAHIHDGLEAYYREVEDTLREIREDVRELAEMREEKLCRR